MANKNKKRQNSNGTQSSSTPPVEQTTAHNTNTNSNTNNKNLTSTNNHDDNTHGDHESPLKVFGEAKVTINQLYQRLDNCVTKASNFYSSKLDSEVQNDVDIDRLSRLSKSIETIKGVLARNQMKVAFFGRTSNGKSTVINAILHDKVLPMGYGHTTACFLQIEGNEENEAYLEVQKDGQAGQKKPIQSVSHIANALNSGTLEYSTLVKIHWPITKCPLLKYDVVLVDSPGVDVEENLDQWIDEHCHDADVFVLVSNAESTINIAEKNFFIKVSDKLSKPNIFILNNRWDSITEDIESMEQVREQHVERAVNFLSDQLKVSSKEEARQRTFFVSARETLLARLPTNQNEPPKVGYSERNEEFKNFEKRFEEALSKSAVQTKFQKHTDKARETINELTNILNSSQSLVTQVSNRKLLELRQNKDRYKSIHDLFHANENGLREEIFNIKKKIQIVADTEFDNEVRRLSRVVEDFEYEFSLNPVKLRHYKEQLYLHVEETLSENLKSRINTVVGKHVNPFNKVMSDLSLLLTKESQQKTKHIIESQSYFQEDLFDLKIYKQFYTEFQEDLEFRFSLGIVSIIRKFQSTFSSGSPSKANLPGSSPDQLSANTDFLAVMERFMLNPRQSTTVGSLAAGGVLVNTLGWKVIIVTSVVYGALYAYEYLTWTNAAKERAFKAQYTRHARKGLHDCVPIISQHIANSVEQKLTDTFSKVKEEIDTESEQLNSKIGLLGSSLEKLRIFDEFTTQLLGENDVLLNELVVFAKFFLST